MPVPSRVLKRLALLLLAASTACAGSRPSRSFLSPRAPQPDILASDIEVWVSPPAQEVRTRSVLHLGGTWHPGETFELQLREEYKLERATIEGQPVAVTRDGSVLTLRLPHTLLQPPLVLRMETRGSALASHGDQRPVVDRDSVYLLWSDAWYPWRLEDWSPTTVTVHLPAAFKVIGPGVEVAQESSAPGILAHRFHAARPVTAISIFADRRWTVFEGRGCGGRCQALLYPEESAYAPRLLESLRDVVDFYGEQFMPYPYERFSLVEMAGVEARRALAGFITYSPAYLRAELQRTGYDAHETGLQWFCYILGGSWSEWFGDYAAILYHEHRRDRLPEIYDYFRRAYLQLAAREDQPLGSLLGGRPQEIVHGKGPAVVRTLRYVLGKRAFSTTLRCLFARYAYSPMRPSELRPALERCSGRDLSTFFADWIDGAGAPRYRVRWRARATSQGYLVSGELEQRSRVFRTALELQLKMAQGAQRLTVTPRATSTPFRALLPRPPTSLELDPEEWLLKHPPEIVRDSEQPRAVQSESMEER